MRKSFLEKRQARLTAKRDTLKAQALASESVDEVRSITAMIEEINDELSDISEELAIIADEEKRSAAQATAIAQELPLSRKLNTAMVSWMPVMRTASGKSLGGRDATADYKHPITSRRLPASEGDSSRQKRPMLTQNETFWRLPGWLSGKESARQCRRHGFNP